MPGGRAEPSDGTGGLLSAISGKFQLLTERVSLTLTVCVSQRIALSASQAEGHGFPPKADTAIPVARSK